MDKKIEVMTEIGGILKKIKRNLYLKLEAGISSSEIDELARQMIIKENATPAFYKYKNYPKNICISINHELIHGIPSEEKILRKGDLVSIDLGIKYKNYFGDSAFSKIIDSNGKESKKEKILEATKSSLEKAIKLIKPGLKIKELGLFIENYAKDKGFFVTKDFVGHGIGKSLHEDPSVPNFYDKNNNDEFEEGMIVCVEPMLLEGTSETIIDPIDDWTVLNKKGLLSCHFEEMILVTKTGYKVLS